MKTERIHGGGYEGIADISGEDDRGSQSHRQEAVRG